MYVLRTECVATHCDTLQHSATHCNSLQQIEVNRTNRHHSVRKTYTLQHAATRCNPLQHTATHCNTLQHTPCAKHTHCNTPRMMYVRVVDRSISGSDRMIYFKQNTLYTSQQVVALIQSILLICMLLFFDLWIDLFQAKYPIYCTASRGPWFAPHARRWLV